MPIGEMTGAVVAVEPGDEEVRVALFGRLEAERQPRGRVLQVHFERDVVIVVLPVEIGQVGPDESQWTGETDAWCRNANLNRQIETCRK